MRSIDTCQAIAASCLVCALASCGSESEREPALTSVSSVTTPGEGSSGLAGGSEDGVPTTGEVEDTGGTGDTGEGDSSTEGTPAGTRRLELAGHALVGHPWFRAVQNFNDDESITIAVDPARVPEFAGQTCAVYVVAARSAAAWVMDPSLVDVRAGGPQMLTIAGDLAATRLEISGPGGLASDAGAGLGVAYDIVLDCDESGSFGAGDIIDGGDAPGLYRTHDTTLPGPLAVSVFDAYASEFLDQRTFYPSQIGSMGKQPLVVVTHGWSYKHTYYDYIGEHLASYGYIVMFHEADVQDGDGAGTISAALTTLDNLEDLLANQDIIGDGVLLGHIDEHRIMLTGHSTGGEAVVRALTQLREGSYNSRFFGYDDIKVVSSMAPVSWHPRGLVDPGDVNYHMFLAGADDDVSGAPELSYTQPRSIYERAVGARQLTYIHGAGHGDLLGCCGELFVDASAPGLIGRAETNRVARGYLLPLAELYLRDNPAGREFFSRDYADYHPRGIAPQVVVSNEHRAARAGAVVIDDFEGEPGLDRSSSGGAVTMTVANAVEVLMQDNDGSLAWDGTPGNGMTHARHAGDDPHAIVFDWSPGAASHYEQSIAEPLRDFREHEFLSLRATQGTRHPETVALAGPLAFTLTLRDTAGVSSSVALAEFARIPPPYARGGHGAGTGWQNEFVTVRVRLTDFLVGSALDLGHIEAVRLEFGAGFGSERGRLGLDDLELVSAQ